MSSRPWIPGNANTPSPTSPRVQELQQVTGNQDLWKAILFSQTPLRTKQDARMSELESLQRKLTSTGERGCQDSGTTLPSVTLFSHKDWASCPETDCVTAMTLVSSHRHMYLYSSHDWQLCPPHSWGHLGTHTQGLQVFPCRGRAGNHMQDHGLTALLQVITDALCETC